MTLKTIVELIQQVDVEVLKLDKQVDELSAAVDEHDVTFKGAELDTPLIGWRSPRRRPTDAHRSTTAIPIDSTRKAAPPVAVDL